VVLTVEYFTLKIPSAYPILEAQLENESEAIETLILGSSQMMSGINAEWLDSKSINLASGSQHHDTDFKLLKGLVNRLPALKTVVLEVSYSHFELPHQGKDFWKNNLFYHYYDVNCFERPAYFKDDLIYLSNVKVFSKQLKEYYIDKNRPYDFNAYGFNFADSYGQFEKVHFNQEVIDQMKSFKINTQENLNLYKANVTLFLEMLDYLREKELNVVICTVPMYKTYLEKRIPGILNRRNLTLEAIISKYPNVTLLDKEESGAVYNTKEFWNQSHLSPLGAKRFTSELNVLLNDLP